MKKLVTIKENRDKHILICSVLAIALFISLIPIFMVAGYDCAAGDDYNYGAGAHLAYLATGSVIEAIKAAVQTTVLTWYGWQGTWFDCFVFCLHPEVFSDSAYVVVPFIFVILQVISFLFFSHHFLKTRWKMGRYLWLEVGLVFLLFSFQLVPSQKSAIFWWVGSVHYAMPMCMALVAIVCVDRFLLFHEIRDYIVVVILAILIGGATYPAIILTILSGLLLCLNKVVITKKRENADWWLLLPFLFEMIGFIISVIAPGNAIRSASDIEKGAQPSGNAGTTIIKSILFSVQDAVDFFIAEKSFVLIALIFIGVLTYNTVVSVIKTDNYQHGNSFRSFRKPLLFIVTLFLLNASIYTPRLYAGGEVSSGYYNFNFWTFFICASAITIYLTTYLTLKFSISNIGKENCLAVNNIQIVKRLVLLFAMTLAVLIIAYLGRHGVKKYTDYVCLEYYLSGQADDYKEQMNLQRMLMSEEGVDDVIVPEVNNEQGPLMQMPIVVDPDNVDNGMASSFYGKNSCRAIPRQEWIEQYGAKYNMK